MSDHAARTLGAVAIALASLAAAVIVVWLRRPDTGLWLPVILATVGCCAAVAVAAGDTPAASLDATMTLAPEGDPS